MKTLKRTITQCEHNRFLFFGFFCQFALQEEEKALIGLAGERTRPHRQQHLMLTVLA